MRLFHPLKASLVNAQDFELLDTPATPWLAPHAEYALLKTQEDLKLMEERTRLVDFRALKDAVELNMAQQCLLIEWYIDGGASQIYLVTLGNGNQIIARLTFWYSYTMNMGVDFAHQDEHDRERVPARLHSEVATLRHVKHETNVPVAQVYAYDNNVSNPVGTAYMLQELVPGEVLARVWFEMAPDQRAAAAASWARCIGTLASLPFSSFGSLAMKQLDIVVGPQVHPSESLSRDFPLPDAGPWPVDQPYAFMLSMATREKLWLESPDGKRLFETLRSEMFVAEDRSKTLPAFTELFNRLIELIHRAHAVYPLPPHLYRPALMHGDLHMNNIIVSAENHATISGVVDWEFSRVVPLWVLSQLPEGLQHHEGFTDEQRVENHKAQVRFGGALIAACPDLGTIVHPQADRMTVDNANAHLKLLNLVLNGAALFYARGVMYNELSSLRAYTQNTGAEGKWAIGVLSDLMTLFA
ncbi:kinase-like domain-containing protein [Amylostereum chailletii]|nr:kinase-like domain-containing protein [Amylostereum chailletii]